VTESITALQLAYHIRRERIGRRRLADRTGLSEMAVRTALEQLRDRKLVSLERSGVMLTSAGRRHFLPSLEPIRSVFPIGLTTLRLDHVSIGADLARQDTGPAWTLRDRAIQEGATGLLLLRFGNREWVFAHDGEPVRRRNPDDAATIEAALSDPRDGDRLMIVSAPDRRRAGLGLWRALSGVLEGRS